LTASSSTDTEAGCRGPNRSSTSSVRWSASQLRYDLRKLKGHGLLQRDGSHYSYRLTTKGIHIALLFLFFHKRLCGAAGQQPLSPPAHPSHQPNSKLEAAYHKADKAIERIVDLLTAA